MKYVAYYRVSTREQESSHLGLDAQKKTVLDYIASNGNEVIAEFTEVESGKKDKRPELLKAIQLCKDEKATLVIAKLDRLSRNVHFISMLMENKVMFVCCDMPTATPFNIHIFAALAQQEREFISERTKSALDAKTAREPDWKRNKFYPDNFGDAGREKAWEANRKNANEDINTRHAWHYIQPLREKGLSYEKIAEMLNKEGYKTRREQKFFGMTVYNIVKRFQDDN